MPRAGRRSAVPPVFYDRRIPIYQARLIVGVALASGVGVAVQTWADAAPPREVLIWSAGAAIGALTLFALMFATQLLGEGTRVRVSDHALHVGYRRIGLDQVAAVSAIEPSLLAAATYRWRIDDRRVGFTRKAVAYGTTRAVLIRQRDGGARPWWLVDVDDPNAFIAAIAAARARPEATAGPEGDG